MKTIPYYWQLKQQCGVTDKKQNFKGSKSITWCMPVSEEALYDLDTKKKTSQWPVDRADLPGTGGWTHPSKASEWAWTSAPAWDTYTNTSFGKDASHLASEIGHEVTTSHQRTERKLQRKINLLLKHPQDMDKGSSLQGLWRESAWLA